MNLGVKLHTNTLFDIICRLRMVTRWKLLIRSNNRDLKGRNVLLRNIYNTQTEKHISCEYNYTKSLYGSR